MSELRGRDALERDPEVWFRWLWRVCGSTTRSSLITVTNFSLKKDSNNAHHLDYPGFQ